MNVSWVICGSPICLSCVPRLFLKAPSSSGEQAARGAARRRLQGEARRPRQPIERAFSIFFYVFYEGEARWPRQPAVQARLPDLP